MEQIRLPLYLYPVRWLLWKFWPDENYLKFPDNLDSVQIFEVSGKMIGRIGFNLDSSSESWQWSKMSKMSIRRLWSTKNQKTHSPSADSSTSYGSISSLLIKISKIRMPRNMSSSKLSLMYAIMTGNAILSADCIEFWRVSTSWWTSS